MQNGNDCCRGVLYDEVDRVWESMEKCAMDAGMYLGETGRKRVYLPKNYLEIREELDTETGILSVVPG
jgi:hypothetical protein